MSDLMKLVKTYRLTRGLAERLDLAERIVPLVERDLRFFVFAVLRPPAAEDVFQEVLKAVFTKLGQFQGDTKEAFWDWCYTIARRKIADHCERQDRERDRLQFMPGEELLELVKSSVAPSGLSAADRLDFEHVVNILARLKPDCEEHLWQHYIHGLNYAEIAAENQKTYNGVRMKIERCLEEAQSLAQNLK